VGEAVLNLAGGTLTLANGGLPAVVQKSVTLGRDGGFTVDPEGTEAIHLRVDAATGLISGDFIHPDGGVTPIRGVVNQSEDAADGYFLGPQRGGLFQIRAPVILQ
jgi:hypothetical protein